ncbi:helix-turn-helix transcriptional regulator [Celeribacter arenosi]|uniref:AraC family transcriptional regulator n=1 Tax=Celeribacter arenosi TaxID=792649 RepID=A0ABP7KHL9_9RHOB
MDEIVTGPFDGIPADALRVRLARSTIKMSHSENWRVDKSNPDHDLVICLTGSAIYDIADQTHTLHPGDALLIPAGTRFCGQHGGGPLYTGIAQHFSLDLFGHVDMVSQMDLAPKVTLSGWDYLAPLIHNYHATVPRWSTTLTQHHYFMTILLSFLQDAFLGWRDHAVGAMDGRDALSLHIMLCAAKLSGDPIGETTLDTALAAVPYNGDYFRRAFRDRLGFTPQKFLELKKMEAAKHGLLFGRSVKEVAADVGYRDVYFFSRMFKQYMGAPPSSYRLKARDRLARLQEQYTDAP